MWFYRWRVSRLHRQLGIDGYAARGLPLQSCARNLVAVPGSAHLRMTKETLERWLAMKDAASTDHVDLRCFNAFRSLEDQVRVIRGLLRTQTMPEVLLRAAAPGYSEHHTGRALDIGTTGCFPPTPEFENTPAFRWLATNAVQYGFVLSYPRGNPHGIIFEPWHWLQSAT